MLTLCSNDFSIIYVLLLNNFELLILFSIEKYETSNLVTLFPASLGIKHLLMLYCFGFNLYFPNNLLIP